MKILQNLMEILTEYMKISLHPRELVYVAEFEFSLAVLKSFCLADR
jgi:hypothetical protein